MSDQQKDYGEILCAAVDQIITQRLQGLQYDITKLCTVVDNSDKNNGRYIVSDGSARFEAFTQEKNYQNGNSVLVTIPNGDYNMQKIITGRVSTADTTPFNYTPPMETMLKITNNVFDDNNAVRNSASLLANKDGKDGLIGPIYSVESNSNKFAGFTRLGITADFQSWLTGLDVVSGMYGLKILIYADGISAPGTVQNQVYELTFSSADMLGNPYQFESYFSQEKVFDISNITNIKKIDIYFYQNGDFRNGQTENNYIPYKTDYDYPLENDYLEDNLFVDNIKVYLGYDINEFQNETLMIFSDDILSYHHRRNPNTKYINLRWIHKIDDFTYELLDKNSLASGKYEIRWFQYVPECEEVDKYAGKDWKQIEPIMDDPFVCAFVPDCTKRQEEIKVVGLIKDDVDLSIEEQTQIGYTDYYSNLLTFTNEEDVPDKTTFEATSALSIYCADKSEGNYFIYNQNGKIINEGVGQGYNRQLKVMYKGTDIANNPDAKWIQWWFPDELNVDPKKRSYTMLLNNFSENDRREYLEVDGTFYVGYKEERNEDKLIDTINYSIKNNWMQSNSNNTVRCTVKIGDVEYQAVEELRFGKAGTNGANATFILEFGGNNNALAAVQGKTVQVIPRLYDGDGRRIDFTEEQAKLIEYSWHNLSNNNYISIEKNLLTGRAILTSKVDTVPNDNYSILKAIYPFNVNGKTVNLEAYLPIPLKQEQYSHIEGAREVIYNYQGVPSYYTDAYVLMKLDESYQDVECEWQLSSNKDTMHKLITIENKKVFRASPFYVDEKDTHICIYALSEEEVLWSQPILIMQNQYDFTMLNQWDGSLTIDEENGTILSSMLGAGRKNDNNTFSGVLIGDISAGTGNDEAIKQTGVYGFDNGTMSYALKEDGTATFGAKGKGQIQINGNDSTIKSANFNSGSGMKIDLDDGTIDIIGKNDKNELTGQIKIAPVSPYMQVISGTKHENLENEIYYQPIINLGTSDYFIQSDNYTSFGNAGTKLNLTNGSFEIKDPYVKTFLGKKKDDETSENIYFQIIVPPLVQGNPGTAANDLAYNNRLLSIGENNYYLQSINYAGLSFNTITKDNIVYNLYNNGLVAVTPDGEHIMTRDNAESSNWTELIFTPKKSERKSYDEDGKEITITESITKESQRATYLAKLTPYYTKSQGSGMHLDLASGIINGYDLMLKGTNADDSTKTIVIDSSSSTTPLTVGKDFNVSWDGSLTCNKLNELSNVDNEKGYIINISDNFYVTQGGGAGGSGVKFSGGFSGGFSGIGSGTFKGKGDFDELTAGKIVAKGNKYLDATFKVNDVTLATMASAIANLEKAMATLTKNYNDHTHSIRSENATGTTVVKSLPTTTGDRKHAFAGTHNHPLSLAAANKTTVHSAPVKTGTNDKTVKTYSGTMSQQK